MVICNRALDCIFEESWAGSLCVSLNLLNFRAEEKQGRDIPQSTLLKSVGFTSLSWLSAPLDHCQISIRVCKHFSCESERPCGCYAWFTRCIPGVQILILLVFWTLSPPSELLCITSFPISWNLILSWLDPCRRSRWQCLNDFAPIGKIIIWFCEVFLNLAKLYFGVYLGVSILQRVQDSTNVIFFGILCS